MICERIATLAKCSVCVSGVHEATCIKPTGPISGHLMQSVGQLLGYPTPSRANHYLCQQLMTQLVREAYTNYSLNLCDLFAKPM